MIDTVNLNGRPHALVNGLIEARGFMPVDPEDRIEVDGLIDRAKNFEWSNDVENPVRFFKIVEWK